MTTKLAAVSLAASLALTTLVAGAATSAQEAPGTAAPGGGSPTVVSLPFEGSAPPAESLPHGLLESTLPASEPLAAPELDAAALLAEVPDVARAVPVAPEPFAATEPSSVTVVAEPGTWALLGLGIVGLGLARRRLAALGRDDGDVAVQHRP